VAYCFYWWWTFPAAVPVGRAGRYRARGPVVVVVVVVVFNVLGQECGPASPTLGRVQGNRSAGYFVLQGSRNAGYFALQGSCSAGYLALEREKRHRCCDTVQMAYTAMYADALWPEAREAGGWEAKGHVSRAAFLNVVFLTFSEYVVIVGSHRGVQVSRVCVHEGGCLRPLSVPRT
jgi:hypothetical protein